MRKLLGVWLLACAMPAMAVEIDGKIDPQEWAGAQHVDDFRMTQPLTRMPGSQPTEAWILATPEGLAIGFRNTQPAGVPRTRQRVQRDFDEQVDRVNLMVDFDGDGRTGYNFTVSSTDGIADAVISNENNFNDDWDGNWRHAVGEDADGWSVEMLIPWYIAPMRKASGDKRTLKIYLDRVIGSTGERSAWPAASFERPRFMSDFTAVEMTHYNQSLLTVTPYVSGLYDNVRGDSDFDGGADIFWKPNGQFQMTATINPDFGQVESDDLVVNFGATETFISDKRPFFTENQGLFEYTTPSDFSQLLYTRRVGGPADDGKGSGDITAAVKVNGSLGATKYGVFVADEAEEVGRSFGALRLVRDFGSQNLGMMLTQVDRPYLDREATVLGVDHNWRPNQRWNVQTRVFGSQIEQSGETTRDLGATLWADYEMDRGWRQQWIAMHFGNDLQINDAGYLSRNSTNYLHWEVRKRFADQPEQSRYSSKEWRWRASSSHNDHGEKLNNQFRVSREGRLRDGSYEYAQINVNSAGVDDLVTRGHGSVKRPSNFNAYFEYERPRKGRWGHQLETELYSGGLAGNSKIGYSIQYEPTYFVSDAFSLTAGVYADHTPDWLVWNRDSNLLGSYDGREVHLNAGLDWTIGSKQELRVKLQAIALDAKMRQTYAVDGGGNAVVSPDKVDDFSVKNLGFQIRYRYELAPLSYLYVVYGRGGYRQEANSEDTGQLLSDSFDLRDDEQLLVKLSYRFEL
ncbi:DUF5916 domain-containing protein [Pseudoxanthomonas sacheonensis]|uniref:DUF5916 domain-containing protein n=1 Tax=Pseudoxanthomonas sacheonensis TaxID=443615 RepID=A0ABU1RMI7_9GAMM|nr:DUF5916 domain-containing protein [Pseudoxanthomonas sacheonensis]MDR6839993.1 hypothetical protein [Pseudoxanthomonas sacheonensis]